MYDEETGNYVCDVCGEIFKSAEALDDHILNECDTHDFDDDFDDDDDVEDEDLLDDDDIDEVDLEDDEEVE